MKNNTNHLYIHIPFCKEICTYCDFYRTKTNNYSVKKIYINKIINELNQDNNLYKTIYIGGGTPNYLDDELLNNLLKNLKNKLQNNFEFTIECNPEFINENQLEVFKKNNVNRISLGVQTLNENILKLLKRTHNNNHVYNAIKLLNDFKFNNISLDFIYNLPLMKNKDLYDIFKFIKENYIKHISFYSLEIKEGSILNKSNYKINHNLEEEQFEIIKNEFEKLNYDRYEISNWAINHNYYSNHNLAYWNMENWKALGISSYGFENNIYYKNEGNINDWKKIDQNWSKLDLLQNIFIMGLRKTEGIDLNKPINKKAYLFLKNKLNFNNLVLENNKLKVKNIDLLNETLIDII